jgi:hypothetical protein
MQDRIAGLDETSCTARPDQAGPLSLRSRWVRLTSKTHCLALRPASANCWDIGGLLALQFLCDRDHVSHS